VPLTENSASANTRRPIATASQSSLSRAFSTAGSDTLTAMSDMFFPDPMRPIMGEFASRESWPKRKARQSYEISLFEAVRQTPSPEPLRHRRNGFPGRT
jgi:hypothetical protein